MMNIIKIKTCKINPPKGWGCRAEVFVTYENDVEEHLFSYYDDELNFSESEFVGLTKEQALELYHQKDVAYLKS